VPGPGTGNCGAAGVFGVTVGAAGVADGGGCGAVGDVVGRLRWWMMTLVVVTSTCSVAVWPWLSWNVKSQLPASCAVTVSVDGTVPLDGATVATFPLVLPVPAVHEELEIKNVPV